MNRFPHKIEDLPKTEFYAILTPKSVTTTVNFGPPDPPNQEVTDDYWAMEVFPTREAWEAEIQRLSSRRATGYCFHEPFKAVIIKPVEVSTRVVIDIGNDNTPPRGD